MFLLYEEVLRCLIDILKDSGTGRTVLLTIVRFILGLGAGIVIGSVIGFLFGIFPKFERLCSPYLNILQATPPVCWVVLALVWFGFNGKPSIFIVATATIPVMVINLSSGIKSIDSDLMEMAQCYHFSKAKVLRHIVIPTVSPYFQSALHIVIGNGWKLVVMAEVLTTNTGIGGAILSARLNIEPEMVIAWAVITITACYLTQALIKKIFLSRGGFRFAKAD